MNQKIKNILGFLVGILLIVLIFAVFYWASYYALSVKSNIGQTFSATADASVYAIADIAQFSYSVISQGKDIAQIQQDVDSKINKADQFIQSQGVATADIKTSQYSLEPQYQYYSNCSGACPPPKIIGYTLTQTVQVKIRDFSKIGPILQGLVANGINQISGLNFKVDDQTKYEDQATKKAIVLAKERAKTIAQAGGFGLGRLISVQENSSVPQPIYYAKSALSLGEGMAPAPTIEPGTQEIKVYVTLRYEIR